MLSTMKVETRTFIILVCSTVHLNAEKSQILDFSINVHHFLTNTQYLANRHRKRRKPISANNRLKTC